jgi:hypothetical protein
MPKHFLRLACLAAVGGLALAACGGGPDLHQGFFSYGFETVAFRPCGSAEQWWVVGDGAAMETLIEQYSAVAGADYAEVYVEVRGDPSDPGTYGHLGAYTRELSLTEVVSVGGEPPADCT